MSERGGQGGQLPLPRFWWIRRRRWAAAVRCITTCPPDFWQGYSEEFEANARGFWLGLIFNKIKKKATSLPACKLTSGSCILRAKYTNTEARDFCQKTRQMMAILQI